MQGSGIRGWPPVTTERLAVHALQRVLHWGWQRRAELEEKLARLQRIVGAMNAEEQPAAEPGAVERAARGMATPGPAGGVPSPKLTEAISGGKIATRKRVLTNLARPMPYALRG